jgi:Na+-transporting NADH:ubiquinone oxidoreductase subunit C
MEEEAGTQVVAARRNKTAERLFTVQFMVGITFVAISAVSALYLATASTVARNETLFMKRAVAQAANRGDAASSRELLDWYDARVTPVPSEGTPRYLRVQNENGQVESFVFVREGTGLWGPITAVCGMDAALKSFTGVSFVKHNETPGLGARISEDWFRQQIIGKRAPLTLVPEKTQSDKPTEIDGITGATITSTAVRDILGELHAAAAGIVSDASRLQRRSE